MDAFAWIAERRIEQALEDGLFDHLPALGEVDCSLHGEAFFRQWLACKLEREGYVPAEVERILAIGRVEREIAALAERVRAGAGDRVRFEEKVAERNRLVRDYNLTMPAERHLIVRTAEQWLGR